MFAIALILFSFLFYSIREMSVVPHCMEEQKLLIFSTVHLCSIRYLPRLWGPLHSIAESQPELEQRFVWSVLLPLAVLKWQRTRTVQTQPSRVLQAATLNTAGWSCDRLVLLCLMQPRVGFALSAARAHTLKLSLMPLLSGSHDLRRMWKSMNAARGEQKRWCKCWKECLMWSTCDLWSCLVWRKESDGQPHCCLQQSKEGK